MFADYHVHSNFSPDSSESMENIVLYGIKNKINEICFTDHVDFDSTDKSYNYEFDQNDYFREIDMLKERYGEFISLKYGVEMGIQPHVLSKCKTFIQNKNFDFVIASMHGCRKLDFYTGDFFKKFDTEEGIFQYYSELEEMVKVYDTYNVIGHIDIYKRYKPECMKVKFNSYRDYVERVLKIVISNGKGIEVNTSGLLGTLNQALPSDDILKLYYELGGEIITLGSDSHYCDTLCGMFNEVLLNLKNIGFKEVFTFDRMTPKPLKISSLL